MMEDPAHGAEPRRLWARRLGWMMLLWAAGVAAMAALALGIRGAMSLAGLTL
jgi:hypothetical protein